jgi:YHS domain-containing protein
MSRGGLQRGARTVSVNKAEKAGRRTTYHGKSYYFSSEQNKEQFEREPERYIREK